MKIWIMNHYATPMFCDKAGRHYWFARKLKERGYDVTIFCASTFLNGNKAIEIKEKKYTEKIAEEIPFIFIKTHKSKNNGIDRIRNMVDFYRNLFPVTKAYAKKNGKPNIIIASSVHPLTLVAGIQIARRMRVPCICEIRDLWPETIFSFGKVKEKSLFGKLLIKGEHWIYRRADALIFTKEGDTDYLREKRWTIAQGGDIDKQKCYYINNGVDILAYEENAKKEQFYDLDLLNQEKFNVIYTGTMRAINNVGNLLDTAKIIKSQSGYEDIQFLIYGDGIQFNVLKDRVEKECLDNVRMKGFVDRRYIPFILSKSSINVLNYSQRQYNWTRGNSSNKLFEYMASGKPVISTVQMGYSIIKKYQCGVELDEDTPEALARQIMRLHDMSLEERSKMGNNAKSGVKDFDFDILTNKLVEVIGQTAKC